MPQANTTQPAPTLSAMPMAGRQCALAIHTRAATDAASPASDAPLVIDMVLSAGARVQRYDWRYDRAYLEELVVDASSIRMARLERGIPLLDSHSSYSLSNNLGVIEQPRIEGGQLLARATFSRRPEVAGVVQDVQDGILRSISAGYARYRVEMVAPEQDNGTWVYRVTDWEPMEGSIVNIPADMDAQIQRAAQGDNATGEPGQATPTDTRTWQCEFIEVRAPATAAPQTPTVGATAETPTETLATRKDTMPNLNAPTAGATTAPATSPAAVQTAAPAADTQRAADIATLCARHGLAARAAEFITAGQTVDQVRAAILDDMATRDAATGGQRNVRIETVRDEMTTRMAGIEQAIMHRVAARTQLDDNGRQYRGLSLLEMGRDFLEAHGVNTRGMAALELSGKILHFRAAGAMGTSDFPSLFANVANKRLRTAYTDNPGTYDLWARRAPNAPNFKNIDVVQLGAAPELLQTNEHGEFKYGSMADGKETYAVVTYGRIVNLTRQAIMNDDLRGFDRLVTAFGASARRLENRLVYSQLTANAAMGDGTALFHADHANLGTGGGSALAIASLTAGRTAMRKQTGLAGEPLNIAPAYLIVPAALEQTAYQLTSSAYVPATKAEINEFRAGGRTSVEPVVEPLLDATSATAWYLAANSGQVDTVEYCYLDGAEGPVIEAEVGFEVDGVSYKCREDFATKAIDHRGLYKAAGA